MPNIFKRFSGAKAEPYQFPDATELLAQELETELISQSDKPESEETAEQTAPESTEEMTAEEKRLSEAAETIRFAQIQADSILEDAQRKAAEILEQARKDAEAEADAIRKESMESGRQEGYIQGIAQANQEAAVKLKEQGDALLADVQQFLDKAGTALDRQMDQNVNELRDLALAVAEKVVCISLRSSSEVISRMIQNAIDKRKSRDWVHIYIAECDAKRMGQVPASLSAALSALSDRVRIIPMANDETGTCIIETPDEIVDASAATQMSNIRNLLMDTPAASTENDSQMFFNAF